MRTVTFKSVIDGALARMGLDPVVTPASNTLSAFTEYANSAIRAAQEMYPWPDFVRYEQRQAWPDWAAGEIYSPGLGVLASDGAYYFPVISSEGVDPTTDDGTYWMREDTYAPSGAPVTALPLQYGYLTEIGEVLDVYSSDPRVSRYATRLSWSLTNDGIVVAVNSNATAQAPAKVWVKFTTVPPVFTTASYTNGDTVPYVLSEAVKFGICAEAQREDGQFDKAAVHEQNAMERLQIEWDKLEMKQGQQGRFNSLHR